jgi:hypothetical protein
MINFEYKPLVTSNRILQIYERNIGAPMPIPDEARPPANSETSIVRRAEAPAKPIHREVQILVASLNAEKREITMNLRHYQCMVPKDWIMYDDSYKASGATGELPGRVDVQFVAPAKDGTVIMFTYRGRSISKESAALFHKLLQGHGDTNKSEPLTKTQIQKLTSVFDSSVGCNQYAAELDPGFGPPQFKMTSAQLVSINHNAAAVAVAGEWRNDPEKQTHPQKYWYKLYLDGTGDGENVHEILYTSDSKESFEKNKPVFDQVLRSLSW